MRVECTRLARTCMPTARLVEEGGYLIPPDAGTYSAAKHPGSTPGAGLRKLGATQSSRGGAARPVKVALVVFKGI